MKSFVFCLLVSFQTLILKMLGACLHKSANTLSFIPHGGMKDNGYDLFNYKSDNALALLNYMIKKYGAKYRYRLACDYSQCLDLSDRIKRAYPTIDIECFPFFGIPPQKRFSIKIYFDLLKSKYIFTSEVYPLPFKTHKQTAVFLSYFIPFKDDYHLHHVLLGERHDRLLDICISSCKLASYINSQTYSVSFSKFKTLGFPRDDELMKDYDCPELDRFIMNSVDYEVKKVFLMTPTHRDYEAKSNISRCIFGFDINKNKVENFLRERGILIIVKIHTHQNQSSIDRQLPFGMIIHSPNSVYGLCELMQRSDCLLTDYTSAYLDYLLLDRPVLFNFYDYEKYERTRGFSYDPLEPILAGDIFTDEDSFFEKMQLVIDGVDKYKEKRYFVRNLTHKYLDTDSSERICDYVLN